MVNTVDRSGNLLEGDVGDGDALIPARYPELAFLLWNRDPKLLLSERDAFSIYERNWRFVDVASMGEEERALVERLTARYGKGVLLA